MLTLDNLPSGIYIMRVQAATASGTQTATGFLTLMK